MEIKVLGTGCPKCRALEKAVKQTLDGMEVTANVVKEEDIVKIMAYGVMTTPALLINEKMVHSGSVPSMKKIKEYINQNLS